MLLLALLVHTLWLASWYRGPHCAILNQLQELELMLLLAFFPLPKLHDVRGPYAPAKACSES